MAEPGGQERRRCGDLSEPAAWRPGLPRTEDLDWNEWALAHSNCIIHTKRVGTNPLETQTFIKTSGCRPTQNANFYENEWTPTHSNQIF